MGDMTYRQLGDSGLTVSTVGLGCNQIGRRLDLAGTRAVVDAAFDAGITFFDAADIYGTPPGACEDLLGQALEGRRDGIVLATKFGMPAGGVTLPAHEARGSRRYIRASIEGSLRRLRTDHIDLYQLHRPDEPDADRRNPCCAGRTRARRQGSLHRFVAVRWLASRRRGLGRARKRRHPLSSARRTSTACWSAAPRTNCCLPRSTPASASFRSIRWHVACSPASTRAVMRRPKARVSPATPNLLEHANWDVIEALQKFASARGISMLEVAIGGLAAQPGVSTVIVGATKPEQVLANAQAASWEPAAVDLVELDGITGGVAASEASPPLREGSTVDGVLHLSASLITVVLLAALVLQLYALVDAALAPAAAYVAAGKLTKQAWLAILAVAVVVVLLSGWFGPLGLAAIIATIVYFVDVRPALRRVRGR